MEERGLWEQFWDMEVLLEYGGSSGLQGQFWAAGVVLEYLGSQTLPRVTNQYYLTPREL